MSGAPHPGVIRLRLSLVIGTSMLQISNVLPSSLHSNRLGHLSTRGFRNLDAASDTLHHTTVLGNVIDRRRYDRRTHVKNI